MYPDTEYSSLRMDDDDEAIYKPNWRGIAVCNCVYRDIFD